MSSSNPLGGIRMTYEFCIEGINCARAGDTTRSLNLFKDALMITPTSSAAHLCLGLRFLAEGKALDALYHFDKGLDLTSSPFCRSRLLRSRALLHHSTREYTKSLIDFDLALALDPDFADAYYLRGLVSYDLREFDSCVKDMTMAINLSDQNLVAAAYMNRGNAYTELGQHVAAIQDLTRAISLDPDTSVIHYNRANVYCLRRELHLAVADYTKAIELDPYHASAYFNRGNTYHELGQYELAVSDFTEAVHLDPGDAARFLESRGCSYCRMGQLDAAYNDFCKALVLKPNSATVYLNRSTVLFRLDRYHDALDDLNHCLSLNPSCSMAYTKRADIHLRANRFRQALQDYSAALGINSNDAYSWYMRGRCYVQMGQYAEAIIDFSTVIRIEPSFTRAYVDRAAAYASPSLAKHRLAVGDYSKALELDSKNVEAILGRARSTHALHQHCRTIRDCDRVLRVDPDNLEAIVLRIKAFAEIGAFDEALISVNAVLRRMPRAAPLLACRADVYMAMGKPELALDDYGRAVAVAPSSRIAMSGVVLARQAIENGSSHSQIDLIEWHLQKARRLSSSLRTRDALARALINLRLAQYDKVLYAIESALECERDEIREHLLESRSMIQFRQSSKARQILGLDGLITMKPWVKAESMRLENMGSYSPRNPRPVVSPSNRIQPHKPWRTSLRRSISVLLSRTRLDRSNP